LCSGSGITSCALCQYSATLDQLVSEQIQDRKPRLILSISATSIVLIVVISNPKQGETSALGIDFAICWYVLSVSINILSTFAIVGRLLWKRRTIITLLGKEHSKVYIGVAAMLVESAVLYSVFGVIFIGTYFKQNPVTNLVIPILGTLEVSFFSS
jgi:hypothetical protein